MTATLILICAGVAAIAMYLGWRTWRKALATRLLHTLAETLEALDRGDAPLPAALDEISRARFAFGAALSNESGDFVRACRALGPQTAGPERERAFALGDAVERTLRDRASGHAHDLVTRA